MYSRIWDPGSGAFLPPGSGIRIRDGVMVGSGSWINHPGSATLHDTVPLSLFEHGSKFAKKINYKIAENGP
jgi:hypothetical protein